MPPRPPATPLAGIKVLEFSHTVSGAEITRFADAG